MLDCNNTFIESVNRQVSLMESGNVGGGAQLVPHLFQFLVMLSSDSKLVSIPEVVFKCIIVIRFHSSYYYYAIYTCMLIFIHNDCVCSWHQFF